MAHFFKKRTMHLVWIVLAIYRLLSIFFKWAISRSLFDYFLSSWVIFPYKKWDSLGIWTWINWEEGEHTDHLATTAPVVEIFNNTFLLSWTNNYSL